MTKKEFDVLVKRMKEELGYDDDKILRTFFDAFVSGNCSIEDYETMVHWLGYELTDEFYEAHHIKRNR